MRSGVAVAVLLAGLTATAPACRSRETAAQAERAEAAGLSAPPPSEMGTFEAGLQSGAGIAWAPVTDERVGGASAAQIVVVDGGAAGTRKALAVTGNVVLKDFPFPFAGGGLKLAETPEKKPHPVDVSAYQGLQFWAKGDGKRYVLRFMSPEVKDYNYHHYQFQTTAEWVLHRVPFSTLTQFSWGKKIPFPAKSLLLVSFVNYSPPGDAPGEIAFSIDEVAFY